MELGKGGEERGKEGEEGTAPKSPVGGWSSWMESPPCFRPELGHRKASAPVAVELGRRFAEAPASEAVGRSKCNCSRLQWCRMSAVLWRALKCSYSPGQRVRARTFSSRSSWARCRVGQGESGRAVMYSWCSVTRRKEKREKSARGRERQERKKLRERLGRFRDVDEGEGPTVQQALRLPILGSLPVLSPVSYSAVPTVFSSLSATAHPKRYTTVLSRPGER